MRIEHVAIRVANLEKSIYFYEEYFGGSPGVLYHNKTKNFKSCFINFENGCRLELMSDLDINDKTREKETSLTGIAHFAIEAGSKEKVDTLTARLQNDGYRITGMPRVTGDGYYESVVLDPDGNTVEITV
jgi:lactoylglutathione lyase